jgi:hypothetical protein
MYPEIEDVDSVEELLNKRAAECKTDVAVFDAVLGKSHWHESLDESRLDSFLVGGAEYDLRIL